MMEGRLLGEELRDCEDGGLGVGVRGYVARAWSGSSKPFMRGATSAVPSTSSRVKKARGKYLRTCRQPCLR